MTLIVESTDRFIVIDHTFYTRERANARLSNLIMRVV